MFLVSRGFQNPTQIAPKLPLIQEITSGRIWDSSSILTLEYIREELRDLIILTVDADAGDKRKIYLKLSNPILEMQEGQELDAAYDFTDYRLRVNRYITEHSNKKQYSS